MRVLAGLAIAVLTASTATSGTIEDAMKRVGPAYMCGAPYEYVEALDALRDEMETAGVPATLVEYAVSGVEDFVSKEHGHKRHTVTAEECATKYGRAPH